MKYILTRGNSLHYQRVFPKHLQHITGRAMYQRLKLSVETDENTILSLRDSLNQQYEQLVAAAEVSLENPQGLSTASAMLNILQHKQEQQPRRLNDLWIEYCDQKRLKGRALQVASIDWQRFIKLAGNLLANDDNDTNRRLNAALQAQFQTRQQHVKPSTAKRELSQVIAALKFGARKHQIYWRIDPLRVAPTTQTERSLLRQIDITTLITALGNDTSSTDIDALLVLALTSGITPAEVARLRRNDVVLNSNVPHLLIRNSHQRIVRSAPVPIAHDFLIHSLDGAINLAKMSKGYISRICSSRLQHVLNRSEGGLNDLLQTYKTRCSHITIHQHDLEQAASDIKTALGCHDA